MRVRKLRIAVDAPDNPLVWAGRLNIGAVWTQ